MKKLNQFITEYIVKKKLDKFIDSEYNSYPKTKKELIENIEELISKDVYDLNCIDTSAITDMSNLFKELKINKTKYTVDVSKWNVSKVEDMSGMFSFYQKFDFDLSGWDVSNVTNMNHMFIFCENFNCDLSKWNVSKVTDMSHMFYACDKFDSDLSKWDESNVEDMNRLFSYCKNFMGNGLENWNTSKVKDMHNMFEKCISLKNKPSWYKK